MRHKNIIFCSLTHVNEHSFESNYIETASFFVLAYPFFMIQRKCYGIYFRSNFQLQTYALYIGFMTTSAVLRCHLSSKIFLIGQKDHYATVTTVFTSVTLLVMKPFKIIFKYEKILY